MSNEKKTIKVTGPNIGCCTILGLIFITLRLCHVIEWSWIWVLAPFWAPLGLFFIIGAIVCIFAAWLYSKK